MVSFFHLQNNNLSEKYIFWLKYPKQIKEYVHLRVKNSDEFHQTRR